MDTLPSELEQLINSYLDLKSRRMMRLASTHWFNIIRYSDYLVHFTTDQQLDLLLKRLKNYSFPISLEFKKPLFNLTIEQAKSLGQLVQLTKLSGFISNKPPEDLHPLLTNLTNLKDIDMELDQHIVRHFTNLTNLTLRISRVNGSEMCDLDLTTLKKLESIRIVSLSAIKETYDPLLIIPTRVTAIIIDPHLPQSVNPKNFSRFTNLKELKLRLTAPLPHLPKLESLIAYIMIDSSTIDFPENLTRLHTLTKKVNSEALAKLTNLRILHIRTASIGLDSASGLHFLTAMTNLENFMLFKHQENYPQSLQWINSKKFMALELNTELDLNYIRHLSSTLNSLIIDEITPTSSQILQEFTALTKLSLLYTPNELSPIIGGLHNLQSLTCEIRHFEKLTGLEELVLEEIELEDTPTDDDISITHLPLTKLLVKEQISQKFLEKISNITTLKELTLRSCANITDQSLRLLTNLTHLMLLDLSKANAITGVTLTLLTSLRFLSINDCPALEVNEESLKKNMTRLAQVKLYKL